MNPIKDPNRYPQGLNRRKVKALLNHFEQQSDAQAIAQAGAAYRRRTTVLIEIPVKSLPAVKKLLAKRTA